MAFENGRQQGAKEERQVREQKNTNVLETISQHFDTLLNAESYREKLYEREALKLSLEIIDQLIPSLHHAIGKDALRRVLPEIINSQSGHSELIITVHPDNAAAIDTMLEELASDEKTSQRFKVVADSNVDTGGCELSWKDGGMIRTPEKSVKEMRQAISTLLNGDEKGDETNAGLTTSQNNAIKEEEIFDSNKNSTAQAEDGETN